MTAANSQAAELAAAVRDAQAAVEASSEAIADLRTKLHRHWLAITLSAFGLVVDLALSVLFLYQHGRQNCTNERSRDFFVADQAKVRGQIFGVDEILPTDGSPANPRQGVIDFRTASQHFIDVVGKLPQC